MTKAKQKRTKGEPTDLNLYVLARHFEGRDVAPQRVEASSFQHLKRCLDAGLIEAAGPNEVRLTDAGRAALGREGK